MSSSLWVLFHTAGPSASAQWLRFSERKHRSPRQHGAHQPKPTWAHGRPQRPRPLTWSTSSAAVAHQSFGTTQAGAARDLRGATAPLQLAMAHRRRKHHGQAALLQSVRDGSLTGRLCEWKKPPPCGFDAVSARGASCPALGVWKVALPCESSERQQHSTSQLAQREPFAL